MGRSAFGDKPAFIIIEDFLAQTLVNANKNNILICRLELNHLSVYMAIEKWNECRGIRLAVNKGKLKYTSLLNKDISL